MRFNPRRSWFAGSDGGGSRPYRLRFSPGLLLAPTTLLVAGTVLVPISYAIWLSTREVDLTKTGDWPGVGLQNYRDLLSDERVHEALVRTLFFGSVVVALCIGIALLTALVIRERFFGRGLLLVLALIPWAIPSVVNGIFWRFIYDGSFGLLNVVARGLGFIDDYQLWLDGDRKALALAAVADSWKFTPFVALILLVALESIPQSVYQAARIHGANSLQTFWHITLPGIKRTLILVTIFQGLFTLHTFDLLFVLTRGGPGDATTTLTYRVYRETFELFNLGRGAALGVILAALALLLGISAATVAVARSSRESGRRPEARRRLAAITGWVAALSSVLAHGRSLVSRSFRRLVVPVMGSGVHLSTRQRRIVRFLLIYSLCALILAWVLFPLVYIGIASVQPARNFISVPLEVSASDFSLRWYGEAWSSEAFRSGLKNSGDRGVSIDSPGAPSCARPRIHVGAEQGSRHAVVVLFAPGQPDGPDHHPRHSRVHPLPQGEPPRQHRGPVARLHGVPGDVLGLDPQELPPGRSGRTGARSTYPRMYALSGVSAGGVPPGIAGNRRHRDLLLHQRLERVPLRARPDPPEPNGYSSTEPVAGQSLSESGHPADGRVHRYRGAAGGAGRRAATPLPLARAGYHRGARMSAAELELVGLRKSFKKVRVLEELDLRVEGGQLAVLLGPSGCGKSTTLNIIGGLEEADAGDVVVDGRRITHVPPNRRDMGMVFQSYALYPHMTVRDNVTFGLRTRGATRADANRRATEVAELLEITPLLDRKPAQLSGGEQQRVGLGRALVCSPKVLLMDEPLSNLDAALRVRMRSEIRKLQTHLGTTTVFVTHDQEEAMSIGDAIGVMEGGRIRQFAAPLTVYHEPADLFVARFVGLPQMNLVAGDLRDGAFRSGPLAVPVRTASGGAEPATLGARPESLALTTDDQDDRTLAGRISLVGPLGPETLVEVETPVGIVTVRARDEQLHLSQGDRVCVRWPLTHLHLFSTETGDRLPLAPTGGLSPTLAAGPGSS